MKTKKISAAEIERNESIAALRKILKRGDTVYTVTRKVAPSGMSQEIDLFVFRGARGDQKIWLTWNVGKVLGISQGKDGGLKVRGAGMDMGFNVVYDLSSRLFHGKNRAGYLLKQEWL